MHAALLVSSKDDSEINSAELTSCDESHLRLLSDAFQFVQDVC